MREKWPRPTTGVLLKNWWTSGGMNRDRVGPSRLNRWVDGNAFAKRLESECKSSKSACTVDRAWRLTLSRAPQPKEMALARKFLAGGGSLPEMCLALLNRNEFVYVP